MEKQAKPNNGLPIYNKATSRNLKVSYVIPLSLLELCRGGYKLSSIE